MVVGLETGKWGQKTAAFVGSLARHKAQALPAILRFAAHHFWISRWAAVVVVVVVVVAQENVGGNGCPRPSASTDRGPF